MRILITNTVLAGRSGTEIFVAQLADELRRRGHQPVLYSPRVGPLGNSLRCAGHMVHERIADIEPAPEVIHAHHIGPALTAVTAFPTVPAIFISHGVASEFDAMPLHPSFVRYFTVSAFARTQRASSRLPAASIQLLRNAVDLASFPPRARLPAKPLAALAIVKYPAGFEIIKQFCASTGIALTAIGPGLGNTVDNLPTLFAQADLVFASGRGALEALASGCAVILTDGGQVHGLIKMDQIEQLLDNNLGVQTMPQVLSTTLLAAAINAYDANEAQAVSTYVRQAAPLTAQVDRLLDIYTGVIAQGVPSGDHERALATLVEAYVPSHGYLPWRALASDLTDGAARAKLELLTELDHFAIPDDFSPVPGLENALRAEENARQAALELQRLHASTSWRVTAWLRWLKRKRIA